MTNEADVETAVEDVSEHLGPIDILVNNAGITGKAGKLWELSKSDWEEVSDRQCHRPRALLQGRHQEHARAQVWPHRQHRVDRRQGRQPDARPLLREQGGDHLLHEIAGKGAGGQGDITVNAISPAVIATPILDGLPQTTIDYMVSKIPMGRVGKPEEVAALVHYLASAEASFTTGQCYDISGGTGDVLMNSPPLPTGGEGPG